MNLVAIKQQQNSYIIQVLTPIPMAKQTGMYYIGRYGNIVGSTWKGIPYLRYQPDRINQSEATKQSCNYLAQASPIAASFRRAYVNILPQPKNREMQNSFNGAIKKWLATKPFDQYLPSTSLPFVTGFEFNNISLLQDRLHVSMQLQQTLNAQLILQIPAFVPNRSIAAPAYNKELALNIIAACYNIQQSLVTNTVEINKNIPYNSNEISAEQITLPFTASANNLVLVAAVLQYTTTKNGNTNIVNDLRWLPCGIVCGMIA